MADTTLDKDFLESIIKTIVNNPNDVQVDRTVDEMGVLLTLKVNPEDMGFVIGKRGQTAQAVRTLLKNIGNKINARINLKIHDPNGGRRPQPQEQRTNDEVDTSSLDEGLKI